MRLIKIVGFLTLLLVIVPLLAVQLFGGPIARRVVRSLNARLQTEIVIEAVDLSFFRSFPNLSADLQGVTVAGSDGSRLLEADHLACLLDLSSLFGKIRVHGIVIESGKLQLFTDVDGNKNYQLMGYTSVGEQYDNNGEGEGADAGASKVEFAADLARLRDVTLVYQDARLRTDALITVADATFSGDFGAQSYQLDTEADIKVVYLDQDGERYADKQSIELTSRTRIDQTSGGYTFSPMRLTAGELTVEATGQLMPTEEGYRSNLTFNSTSGNLTDIFSLLPPAYAASLGKLESRGDLKLSANVDGEWTDNSYPRINGRLEFTNGRLGSPRMNVSARDLSLSATFAYLDGPRGGIQTFSIDRLSGNFRGEAFDIKLKMEDLNDPRISFSANGSIPIATLPAFFDVEPLTEGAGFLKLDNVTLSGRYADMIAPRRMGRVSSSGAISLEDGELTYNERNIELPQGTLVLNDNALTVHDLRLRMSNTDLTFNGSAGNLIPVLFADSLNTQDAALSFAATLTGSRLDLGELLALSEPTEAEREEAEETGTTDSLARRSVARRARLTDLLDGTFEADLKSWKWEKMVGENFRGQLAFSPGQLDVRGITEAMEGQFRIDATTFFQYTNRIEARLTATDVDVNEFFAQSENFDQEVLTADNLRGRLNAQLLLDLYYDTLGAMDYELMRIRAGIEILDGELRDFGMLENFAFALKAGDLDRVRFTRLANYFEIRERTIYIPAMFIQSSAINLTLSGSHTFDQYLDYSVRVNAGQVLANKISRHDDRLEVLPARNGLFNLYYTIDGPLATYTVESNKGVVKDAFRRSAYRRDRIKAELEERFLTPIELRTTNVEEEDQ